MVSFTQRTEQLFAPLTVGSYFWWHGILYKIHEFGLRQYRVTVEAVSHHDPDKTISLLATQLLDANLYSTVKEARGIK